MQIRNWIGLALVSLALAASPAAAQQREVRICVVRDGELAMETRTVPDSTVTHQREPTPEYAADDTFYINREPITFTGRRYVQHGLPRILEIGQVARVGTYRGLGVYADAGATDRPSVVYLLVRPGCEFQPYSLEEKTGSRGERVSEP